MKKLFILLFFNISISYSQTEDFKYMEFRKNLQKEVKMPRELSSISEGLLTLIITKDCNKNIDLLPLYYSNYDLFIKNRDNILLAVSKTDNLKRNVNYIVSIIFRDVELENEVLNTKLSPNEIKESYKIIIVDPVVISLYPKIAKKEKRAITKNKNNSE